MRDNFGKSIQILMCNSRTLHVVQLTETMSFPEVFSSVCFS